MCGVFGAIAKQNQNKNIEMDLYFGLFTLQHRGEESAGMSLVHNDQLHVKKNMGLVADLFDKSDLIPSKLGIGHVRYSTAGGSQLANAQPLSISNGSETIALAHNGNLVNEKTLKEMLHDLGNEFTSNSDTEVILHLLNRYLQLGIETALLKTMTLVKGSYALIVQSKNKIYGLRDPYGIRPLVLGENDKGYFLSSESCALDAVNAKFIRDIQPGELVVLDGNSIKSYNYGASVKPAGCSFEYIYFARPDSLMDGVSVYESRVKAGEVLFKESKAEADLVVGVPDSGLPAAYGYSKASGIPLGMGFVKSKYIGRSFIKPSEESREDAVHMKLNALKETVQGKRIVLIDDSVVRGTTIKKLIQMLKTAGATEVHVRVASPVVKYPCYFGIDTPYKKDLIGSEMEVESIKNSIMATSLGYLSLDGLKSILGSNKSYCYGCFSGKYPIAKPDEFAFSNQELK